MKRFLLSGAAMGLLLSACSKEKVSVPENKASVAVLSPVTQGQKLVEHSDCVSCHKIDGRLIGPSYKEIAEKYTNADVDKLAQKIINGGSGSWGNIAMTPHPGLSKQDAEWMVKYILSLK